MQLRDHVSIVTGAGGDIGKNIALALAKEGSHVVAIDIDTSKLAEIETIINAEGRRCLALKSDVSNETSVDEAIAKTWKEFDRIDVLVNCAGILRIAPIVETELKDWEKVIAINLTATFLVCRAVLRKMLIQERGTIINIASNAALAARLDNCAYAASKAGVVQLTRVIALEVARKGITVNAISPGTTETAMVKESYSPEQLCYIIDGNLERYRPPIPTGRAALPEEHAALVVFLSSDNARQITGQNFFVDGGHCII